MNIKRLILKETNLESICKYYNSYCSVTLWKNSPRNQELRNWPELIITYKILIVYKPALKLLL